MKPAGTETGPNWFDRLLVKSDRFDRLPVKPDWFRSGFLTLATGSYTLTLASGYSAPAVGNKRGIQ